MQPLATAWMWAVHNETYGDEVFGLSIDLETRTLRWFVHAGCACDFDDAYTRQSPQQFLERGVPGGVADPPEDVLAGIQRAVAALAMAGTPLAAQAPPQAEARSAPALQAPAVA